MIATMLALFLAFLWLGYETDWLMVRLPIGALSTLIEYERLSWDVVLARCVNGMRDSQKPFWLKHPDNMSPLCGLDWLEANTHIVPEYKIELAINGNRYNMVVKEPSILKEVVKVNTQKLKPKREVYSPKHYALYMASSAHR